MTDQDRFAVVGILNEEPAPPPRRRPSRAPVLSALLLALIVLGCCFGGLMTAKDPAYMDLANTNLPPGGEFPFGTDTMGRDIFSMIWFGGRVSLFIGFASTLVSTLIAVAFGSLSGMAPGWLDALLMRLTEILLSIPNLLIVVFLQSLLGTPSPAGIALVIGVTSWTSMAKVIRTEVRQLRNSDYVVAARCMGGGFFHILRLHLAPNFVSSIMFMVVMNIRGAIVAESTLSFMGIGLPLDTISWGSMLSLSEKALMTQSWWVLLIPGLFLVATLLCMTNLGNALRKRVNQRHSNL